MAGDPTFHDPLAANLQSAIDKKLDVGEDVLMTLAGATGEALVVTGQRVMFVREQMPIVGSVTDVDCFSYSYEQIRTVLVEETAGGGRLKLVLVAPPLDDNNATLFFPSYDITRFETAAARIRMLAQQTSGMALGAPATLATAGSAKPSACSQCGELVEERDLFCAQCGAPQQNACRVCYRALPANARVCPHCATPATGGSTTECAACQKSVAPFFAYCPHCGTSLRHRCLHCGGSLIVPWSHCPSCGSPAGSVPTKPSPTQLAWAGREEEASAPAQGTAEEHNERGMRLYNQERYEEAVREFEAALDLAPGNPLYHCNLGVVYAEMGRDDEALEEYQTAIRVAPSDPTAYLNLGYHYSERDDEDEARRMWERVIEVAPDSAEAQEARQNLDHADEV